MGIFTQQARAATFQCYLMFFLLVVRRDRAMSCHLGVGSESFIHPSSFFSFFSPFSGNYSSNFHDMGRKRCLPRNCVDMGLLMWRCLPNVQIEVEIEIEIERFERRSGTLFPKIELLLRMRERINSFSRMRTSSRPNALFIHSRK